MTADVTPDREPPPPLRKAQTALTEQRIIEAATELFLIDGYNNTTLEDVAKRARVGARTVYVRFDWGHVVRSVMDTTSWMTQPADVLGRTGPACDDRTHRCRADRASAAPPASPMERTRPQFPPGPAAPRGRFSHWAYGEGRRDQHPTR
jgi:hypothetical protein